MNTTKQIDLPMETYQQLLEYANTLELKAKSASQGTKVIAAIQELSKSLSSHSKSIEEQ